MPTEQPSTTNDLLRTMICHRTKLISVANRVLRSRELAEDVVQDAALKACQMNGGPPLGCPLRFSCSVVRNLAIDRARRCALEQRHATPLLQAEGMSTPLDDPLRTLEGCEMLDIVMRALRELPERTRTAFELHRFHDVPQKTIAASLGVSPTLVNFMIQRAQEHCRARLEGDMASLPIAPNKKAAPTAALMELGRTQAIQGRSSARTGASLAALQAANRYAPGNVHSLIRRPAGTGAAEGATIETLAVRSSGEITISNPPGGSRRPVPNIFSIASLDVQ